MSFGDRGSLTPLPQDHRRGLIVLTSFSFLSFISTSFLWIFLTCKLVLFSVPKRRMRRRIRQAQTLEEGRVPQQVETCEIDLSGGLRPDLLRQGDNSGPTNNLSAILDEIARLAEDADTVTQSASEPRELPDQPSWTGRCLEKVNPFPTLVYNLLLADMMEAFAYALSIKWVAANGIYAPSATCWAQGWLGSTSNLASSMFLTAISTNSFLTIVFGYRLPRLGLYGYIAGIWTFVLLINGAGVLLAEGGNFRTASGESYFMRANVWCWISSEYNAWRLWSHYFWIIVSVTVSLSFYFVIIIVLFVQKRDCRHLPRKKGPWTPDTARLEPETPQPSGYHPAFLAYPFVYLLCITPLVIGRIAIIFGKDLGTTYFAIAGSILAGNGLLNSILWITTIVFSAADDMKITGLDQFSFVRTPARNYGHRIIISGPTSRGYDGTDGETEQKEWWWWRLGGLSYGARARDRPKVKPNLGSVPSNLLVEGPFIRIDVVTHIVSESTAVDSGSQCDEVESRVRANA